MYLADERVGTYLNMQLRSVARMES
jgi:hypothetical protein